MKEEAVSAYEGSIKEAVGALYDAGFADGKAEGGGTVPGTYNQEQVDKMVADALAGSDTPYSEANMQANLAAEREKLAAVQTELDAAKADDESDDAQIAKLQNIVDQVKALIG